MIDVGAWGVSSVVIGGDSGGNVINGFDRTFHYRGCGWEFVEGEGVFFRENCGGFRLTDLVGWTEPPSTV